MTVRDLLSHWGVRRRGSEVVTRIQRDLAEHNLETLPRFDQVAIDDEILVRLSTGVSPSTDEALPEPVRRRPRSRRQSRIKHLRQALVIQNKPTSNAHPR